MAYYAASADDAETNRKFAESLELDYPILSDPEGEVARAYGVLSGAGYAARHTFYIGVDGRILAIDRNVRPATSAEDMAATLGALEVAAR